MSKNTIPPVAKKISKTLEKHGDKRNDDYFWLNDRENAEVIDYLNKENEYYEQMTAHTKEFQKEFPLLRLGFLFFWRKSGSFFPFHNV